MKYNRQTLTTYLPTYLPTYWTTIFNQMDLEEIKRSHLTEKNDRIKKKLAFEKFYLKK